MATYEEQLIKWATERFERLPGDIQRVTLENQYYEGYDCCGGSDPNCYCSFAESATLNLVVTAYGKRNKLHEEYIDMMYGDMGKLLKEIIEA